ncbi:MAG: sigma-70 family RNA polymerase sigma factor [Candidatus Acidiferrales bacterium]
MGDRKLSADDVRSLYERHGAALVAYACTFVGRFSDAEDVVHKIFLTLLRGDTVAPDEPLAYLYRAVRNGSLNARRNGARDVPCEDAFNAGDRRFSRRDGDRESALALEKALGELPEEQRETVVLRIWSGMTLEEIASTLGIPLNTVASRYRYALEKLRDLLRPYLNDERGKR